MAQSVKPADVGVTVGQVFQQKYRVESILGHGGMGVVAECTHIALNERVAIKMLRQDVLSDQDAVARFLREAQAAVKLKSEYVARVSDVGTADNGTPYMVMEFLEGHDLGELLKQRGVLPAQWAVELMLQTAEALCEAHSLGIVHRDIKPTNLFVTWRPDGTALIKVLDFGISKSPMGTDMHLTQTQSLLGTPAYMSPEQMRSARLVDHRTDIWSLGTVFYESLEGHKPFEAESFSEMCVKVAVDPPTPMRNTPPPLQQVILRCLAKAHEQRYANMAEFARDLVPFSADPHAAQMLVERMSRMLKRSTYDWEGNSTGVGRQALPQSIKDVGSGPVRATPLPGWHVGSDPAARPWHQPTPNPYGGESSGTYKPAGDLSQPFARPYTDDTGSGLTSTIAENKKKSRTPLFLLLALLAAGGIAFGVVKATEQKDSGVSQQQVTPGEGPQAGETGSAAAAGSATTPDDPTKAAGATVPQPDGSAGSAAGSAGDGVHATGVKEAFGVKDDNKQPSLETGSGDDQTTKTTKTIKEPAKDPDKTQKSGQQSNKSGKTGGRDNKAGGRDNKTTQTPKKDDRVIKANGGGSATTTPPPEEKKPEPAKPCDPFGAMHGCQK